MNQLYQVVCNKATIAYYEETKQDIEHVLQIFIRCNSGGTTLSYSDLLLSIATSQWEKLDARKAVHQLVDELNRIGHGLGVTKDFVLKAGLMLTDVSSVGFKVRNFTHANMKLLEENWEHIRNALIETVQVVTGFGFDTRSIRATSALLPIAYYLYKIGTPSNFDSHPSFEQDRKAIRGWLVRSILKASGIWGSGLDTLLTALRDVIRETEEPHFPVEEMQRAMAHRGKSLEFSDEEVEDLADIKISDSRVFAVLSLIFSFIDFKNNTFHIDHIFPRSHFSRTRLLKEGFEEGFLEELADGANRLGNLQILEEKLNIVKRTQLPFDWLRNPDVFSDAEKRVSYCNLHLLGDVPQELKSFPIFYETRRSRLRDRIAKLVNTR